MARAAFAMATWRRIIVIVSIDRSSLRIRASHVRTLGMPITRVLERVHRACQCELEGQHAKQQENNKPTHGCLV